jgi:hypothetical protein
MSVIRTVQVARLSCGVAGLRDNRATVLGRRQ